MEGNVRVKQELIERLEPSSESNPGAGSSKPAPFIDLSSSDSSSDDDDNDVSVLGKRPRVSDGGFPAKKEKNKTMAALSGLLPLGFLAPLPPKNAPSGILPLGFLDPLPPINAPSPLCLPSKNAQSPLPLAQGKGNAVANVAGCRHFWKAGDYEGTPRGDWESSSGGMDHVRIHPRFLHSNATSHKWVLGAFAELLDNALDEVCNGATFVNVDMLKNRKDGGRMLMVEDNGGGMDPEKMRQCMSLGYSSKSKLANTIGQYGNGFKTSTMRLGADVIVFSRCCGRDRKRPTQSIGLLSYTFLRSTWKEDIVVPMLDYESGGQEWNKMKRSSASDWNRNLETIVRWSPFSSEADLLREFDQMEDHGTRIIIYNLWEDDQGQLELDFDADEYDIQIRGVNRDERNILMAKKYPNSKHFLTYRHSLRSYASILYLRIPPGFQIILRGKDVEHHNIVNDLMMTQEITYRPQTSTDGVPRDSNVVAVVTIGFVKDAKAHMDVQGFNVYHKNRLIKPFWRTWNACGSDGRGVIGVLEANFVEPAHDKQGFERTIVLSRLEARLVQMQRTFWTTNCHKIGYSRRCHRKDIINETGSDKLGSHLKPKQGRRESKGLVRKVGSYSEPSSPDVNESNGKFVRISMLQQSEGNDFNGNECSPSIFKSNTLNLLKEANQRLKERLKVKEEEIAGELGHDLQQEKERCKSIENNIELATRKIEVLNKEQDSLVALFSEERERRDIEEEELRSKLKKASNAIQELLDRVKLLENM
ncbi:protein MICRORCHIDIA 7-like [Rhododendron vialii]|uniref:protein MICRORCHIDIA 7-like n=1 Tax=Rhododendron vialii TaxID=182163 RepID=UPI00265DCF65|nr:protein MICRORCHIDIA 7-like [Rhododendron vialii]